MITSTLIYFFYLTFLALSLKILESKKLNFLVLILPSLNYRFLESMIFDY